MNLPRVTSKLAIIISTTNKTANLNYSKATPENGRKPISTTWLGQLIAIQQLAVIKSLSGVHLVFYMDWPYSTVEKVPPSQPLKSRSQKRKPSSIRSPRPLPAYTATSPPTSPVASLHGNLASLRARRRLAPHRCLHARLPRRAAPHRRRPAPPPPSPPCTASSSPSHPCIAFAILKLRVTS
jgi:hypothetical protein